MINKNYEFDIIKSRRGFYSMKKRRLFSVLGLSALLLAGCANSDIELTLSIGDGMVENDAVKLIFGLNNTIGPDFVFEGYLTAEKDAVIKDEYVFTYSHDDPLLSDDTYIESTIFKWNKTDIDASKSGDSYGELKFKSEVDLENTFPKDLETKTVYFVFHATDWNRDKITEFGYTEYNYEWKDDKVNISKAL